MQGVTGENLVWALILESSQLMKLKKHRTTSQKNEERSGNAATTPRAL